MPAGQTKFNGSWLSCVDVNNQTVGEWCRKGKDDFHAYCRFCDTDIKCDNSGKAQLLQHAKKEKHKEATKHARSNKQAKLLVTASAPSTSSSSIGNTTSSGASVVSFSYNDASLTAQIYWLAKMASCNFSLRSADHIGDTFKKMFPDSKIAAVFNLSRSSASYMIGEGLAPCFKTVIIEDVKKSNLPFTMHFDETTTVQVKKQMDMTLRYWSPTHNEVWVAYYTSLFFGHAEGAKVASRMFSQMKDDGIPMGKLIALARDGPNVNKTILNELQQIIKGEYAQFAGFVDLGSCVLHTVHNAFGKGLEKYGKDIDQLCLDLHAIFKHSAARREDYKQLQFDMGVDLHTFQQHTEVRWLSIGPAISRIIEQWDAICQFIKDLGKDEKTAPKSVNYKRVAAMLTAGEKDVTKVLLEFLKNTLPLFEEFLTLFQRSTPTIHLVYDSMCLTLLKVMRRFLKPTVLEGKYGASLSSVSCEDVKLQLTDNELSIGDQTRKALACLNPAKQRLAILGIRAFYVATVSHLQLRLPLGNKLLRDLGCLNPLKRNRKSTDTSIQNLTRKLQPQLEVTSVLDEWKCLQEDREVSELDSTQRIDHY